MEWSIFEGKWYPEKRWEYLNMWNIKVAEIVEEKILYGVEVNAGASEMELAKLKKHVRSDLEKDLPNEYISILKIMNGLEFNGFILYGIDEEFLEEIPKQPINGLISFNKDWYENEDQKKYLFLGESNSSWYVYDTKKKQYIELDNPSGQEMSKYNNFYKMLENMLSDSLL